MSIVISFRVGARGEARAAVVIVYAFLARYLVAGLVIDTKTGPSRPLQRANLDRLGPGHEDEVLAVGHEPDRHHMRLDSAGGGGNLSRPHAVGKNPSLE